jgi:hypothetical protein
MNLTGNVQQFRNNPEGSASLLSWLDGWVADFSNKFVWIDGRIFVMI